MGHADAVLCLDEVFDGSEVGLLAGSLDDWVALDGISLLHRNRILIRK
jgi:hypothetical protein